MNTCIIAGFHRPSRNCTPRAIWRLLIFVVGTLATTWLGTHHWQLSNID